MEGQVPYAKESMLLVVNQRIFLLSVHFPEYPILKPGDLEVAVGTAFFNNLCLGFPGTRLFLG